MPAMNAWFLSRFFSSPGWRRIRSRQTSSVSAGSSASGPELVVVKPGTARSTPAGSEVDLAHLGRVAVADLGAGVVGRHPGARARVQRRGVARPPRAVAERRGRPRSSSAAAVPGGGELEAAGEHRVEDDPIAIEVER